MNLEYEKRLEVEVDRELRALPELPAPRTLISRVMMALENRVILPWYRQGWQRWPVGLRAVSFVALLALFGGICFGGWHLVHSEGFGAGMQKVGNWFSGVTVLWKAVTTLVTAIVAVVKNLGTGFILGCLAALALGYAMCVGVGTLWVKLALAQRDGTRL
jgi:hypothetical protein